MVKLFRKKKGGQQTEMEPAGDMQGYQDGPPPQQRSQKVVTRREVIPAPPAQEMYGNPPPAQEMYGNPPPAQEMYGNTPPQSYGAAPPQQMYSQRGPPAQRSQQHVVTRSEPAPRGPPPQQQRQPPPAVPHAASSSSRPMQGAPFQSMSHMPAHNADTTRDVVKKFIADIWNRGDLDLIPEVCHRSLRFNGSVGMDRVGHDGFARMVQTIRDALSDYHCEIHSMVVEGNKAFVRMRFTGRHTGTLLGFEPTGRQVGWMGASEFTIKDGKILKVWELGDVKSLEQQLYPDDEM